MQAVINEGGNESSKRATCLNTEDFFTCKLLRVKYPTYAELVAEEEAKAEENKQEDGNDEDDAELEAAPVAAPPLMKKKSSVVGSVEEEDNLRAQWAK